VDISHPAARSDATRSDPCARQRSPQFRRLLPFEDGDETETCNIVVMEVRGS
jgi:hypothetical protein